jgi:hypothetical protein
VKRKTRKYFNAKLTKPFDHDQDMLRRIVYAKLLVLYREEKLSVQIYFRHDGTLYQTANKWRYAETSMWCQEMGMSPPKIQYLFRLDEIQAGALDQEEHFRIALGAATN